MSKPSKLNPANPKPSQLIPPGADYIVRPAQAALMTGRSLVSIWRDEKAGKFPKKRRIGSHAVGYLHSELQRYLDTLPTVEP